MASDSSTLCDSAIAIIGGGPAGLMAAVLLQRRGAKVTVYERDAGPHVRPSGSTLDVHADSGQRALEAAGLLAPFLKLARPTAERMADERGAIVREESPDEGDAYDRPEIDRGDLHRLLLDRLAPGTVVWDHHFQTLDERDVRFELHFARQPDRTADVVIGASGAGSKVRPYVTPLERVYTGSFIIGGIVEGADAACPAFSELVNRGNLMVRAGGKALFAHTHADGKIDYYISFREPLDWLAKCGVTAGSTAAVVRLLAERLADWAPLYHAAFRATPAFQFLPMYRMPPTPPRDVTRAITLIGDAAHVMPPFAGVGVNIGLMDALILADNLTDKKFANACAAIAAYEQTMHAYASDAQESTAVSELAIHSDMTADELVSATRGGPA